MENKIEKQIRSIYFCAKHFKKLCHFTLTSLFIGLKQHFITAYILASISAIKDPMISLLIFQKFECIKYAH